jgi:CubicO group peptidase (beta-lactamase class C family)
MLSFITKEFLVHITFNRMNRFVVSVAICLFVTQFASAQKAEISLPTARQIAAKADEYMNAAVKTDGFTGAVLVARDGQPIFSKAYGMANFELDVPNTPQTVFRIGSITKQFTAMAIMMLQERGKLSVSDSICKYLSDCPDAWKLITIRNLLTHTSGIVNYGDLPDFRKPGILLNSPESVIALVRSKPLEFTPGEKLTYSNSGYVLLGKIVERASGEDYDDFLDKNIFAPLGMKNSGVNGSIPIIKNRASGYFRSDGIIRNYPYASLALAQSAGSIYSTTEDLLLWDKALYTEKLVSRKSLDEMFTPFRDFLPGTGYAYGWIIGKQSDRQAMFHSGHGSGFAASIVRFLADRVTVIVWSNDINAPSVSIGNALSAIVFGAQYKSPKARTTITLEPQILEKYAGQYQLKPDFLITTTVRNNRLLAQYTGLNGFDELFAHSETDFFSKHSDIQITFIKDAQKNVTGLTMHSGGSDFSLQKIK